MFHSLVGNIGHISIITSFITALLAGYGYFMATKADEISKKSWLNFSKSIFYVHSLAVLSIVVSLFVIIYFHYYEYYYAWSHSSNNLPVHFMISCFWEGQEGSFLLWMFWHCVLGIVLINTQKNWEAPVMAVFAIVQAFLASMILGIVFFELKLGSSPFILLRDFMTDAPIFKMNPEYVPLDGTGLNPLLQNYWMVIHPPTLFLGFATTLVPFAFCIAGLWTGKFKEWVTPAMPWAHFSALVLGIGILMGAYWAYETLNFGGYWNWDPVENAVYVPWLVLVAAIHSMIVFKKNSTALKTAIILTISSFLLILYSTFLTRSGILGNASVHSFTDLGLSGQLLVYLLFFIAVAIFFIVKTWKQMPSDAAETSVWSKEFWLFLGMTALCLAAFQIIATTSIPVYNTILKGFDIKSNLALPADQIAHYSKFQLWFSALIAFLSATAQLFYWKKMDRNTLQKAIYTPLVVTALVVSIVILLTKVNNFAYIILLTTAVYSFISNAMILVSLWKINPKLSGGAIAHIGIALMLIGVLYSAGYSKVVSNNSTGLLYSKEFTTEMNQENVLLWRGDDIKMGDYVVNYKGARIEAEGTNGFIDKDLIRPTQNSNKAIITKDINEKLKLGDTITYMPENTFFEIEFTKGDSTHFTLFPRAQVNKEMGLLASPDIEKMLGKDLYSHVSSIPDPTETKEWSELETKDVKLGDTVLIGDYYGYLEKVERVEKVDEIPLEAGDAAVKGVIQIFTKQGPVAIEPIFVIHNQMVGRVSDVNNALGLRLTLMNIDPKSGLFTLGINTSQKDWVILKAMEKPFIDLLWGGSVIVMIGFSMAIVRRGKEGIRKI
ncbi:MAG: cytochrome c biogenesis protein CcsA [Cytophagales bacterium]